MDGFGTNGHRLGAPASRFPGSQGQRRQPECLSEGGGEEPAVLGLGLRELGAGEDVGCHSEAQLPTRCEGLQRARLWGHAQRYVCAKGRDGMAAACSGVGPGMWVRAEVGLGLSCAGKAVEVSEWNPSSVFGWQLLLLHLLYIPKSASFLIFSQSLFPSFPHPLSLYPRKGQPCSLAGRLNALLTHQGIWVSGPKKTEDNSHL